MVYYLSGTFDCNLWIGSSLTVRLWFAWGSPEVPPRFAYSSLTNRLRFACNSLIPMKFHQRQFVWKTRKLPSNIRAYAKCLASAFNWVSFRDFLTRSRSDSASDPAGDYLPRCGERSPNTLARRAFDVFSCYPWKWWASALFFATN